MAAIILGLLCIVGGLACAGGAVLVFWANAMGSVTNPYAVNLTPAAILAALAVIGLGCGIALLL